MGQFRRTQRFAFQLVRVQGKTLRCLKTGRAHSRPSPRLHHALTRAPTLERLGALALLAARGAIGKPDPDLLAAASTMRNGRPVLHARPFVMDRLDVSEFASRESQRTTGTEWWLCLLNTSHTKSCVPPDGTPPFVMYEPGGIEGRGVSM